MPSDMPMAAADMGGAVSLSGDMGETRKISKVRSKSWKAVTLRGRFLS